MGIRSVGLQGRWKASRHPDLPVSMVIRFDWASYLRSITEIAANVADEVIRLKADAADLIMQSLREFLPSIKIIFTFKLFRESGCTSQGNSDAIPQVRQFDHGQVRCRDGGMAVPQQIPSPWEVRLSHRSRDSGKRVAKWHSALPPALPGGA